MQMMMPAPTLAPNASTPSLITDDIPIFPSSPASPTKHAPAHACCTSTVPAMGDAAASAAPPLPPTDRLLPNCSADAPAAVHPTPLPSPFPRRSLAPPAPPDPTTASTHPRSSHSGAQQPISRIVHASTGQVPQYIHSHASFYALREGAGSSVDLKTGVDTDVEDNEQQYEFATENHKEHRAVRNEVNQPSRTFANNHVPHHDVDVAEDQSVQDPELIYGLRQNPKRSRRFADHDASSEEDTHMANKGHTVDDIHDANLNIAAAEARPASVSYKKSMFTKLQEKTPAACTECGREFSSWKALFGHMRCHPEREWRGIQPPAEYSTRAPSKVKSDSNGESRRYIFVKPLQAAIKHCSQKRTELLKQFKPCKSPPDDADIAVKLANETEDSLLGCFKDSHELQWGTCRTQVTLEEEEESETESIEANYMSTKVEERDNKPLHLSASLPRGKRSKRSHFTIKSLRSVQDQLAAEISHDESQPAKEEDLEMATCLVMLALAGSDTDREKQEAEGAALSKGDCILVDANDDDEGSIGDQLRLSWSRNIISSTTEPKALNGISNIDNSIGSRDGALNVGEGDQGGKYECTACKRIFKSHQALGGHRASHKKVKGCFAKTAEDAEASPSIYHKEGISGISNFLGTSTMLSLAGTCSKDQSAAASYAPMEPLSATELHRPGNCKDVPGTLSSLAAQDMRNTIVEDTGNSSAYNAVENGHLHLLLNGMDVAVANRSSKLALHNNSSKYHQCSICHRVFSSGQALGGHKRCHWAADKTAGNTGSAERGLITVRPDLAGSGRTAVSAMACVAAPAPVGKLSFFARPMTSEEANHHIKVLGIDLNLPAPLDHENGDICKTDNMSAALGSLLSLGQCSSVTIHDDTPIIGFADEDVLHRSSDGGGSVLSVSSSPSSTTSNIPISESGPC